MVGRSANLRTLDPRSVPNPRHGSGNPPDSGSTSGASGDGFHTLAAPNLAIMQCPSNPVSEGDYGTNSYIYNNGMMHLSLDTSTSPPAFVPLTGVGFASSQDRDNGVGNTKYHVTAVVSGKGTHASEGPKVRLDDMKDGQGFTMLFSENVQALPWHRPGLVDASVMLLGTAGDTDVLFTGNPAESARYVHGMVWHYEDADAGNSNMSTVWNTNGTAAAVPPPMSGVFSFHRINGGGTTVSDDIFTKTIGNLDDARNLARPSSAHVDGVNAGFADGATRFVAQGVDYRVYQALMTPRGKSSNVPWPEFVLTDELGE